MTFTKSPGWIASVLLCVSVFLFSGCSDQSEQGVAYRKAESELDRRSDIVKYKDAAILFEKAGNFKDAAKRSKDCWREYGFFRLRPFEGNPLQERLASLQEAKSVFEHIHADKPAAEADAAIKTVQAWLAVQAEQDNGNDDRAIALLEAMDLKDKKVRDALEFIRTKEERQKGLALLQEYLNRVPQSAFVINEKQSFYANLDRLFLSDAFKGKQAMIADALAATRCYGGIARAWNKTLGHSSERKLSFEGGPLETPLTKNTLLLATIQLAEAGDESPEFAELLALLRGIVISPEAKWSNPELLRYAKLLELYNAGPEWADRCFPLDDLKYCNTPGTMDYRILHAPQRIKDVLYDETTDVPQERFTREYSPKEAKALFANFIPAKPLKTGFIVILDRGTPPPYTSDGQMFNYLAYQSPPKYTKVSYERQNKPSQKKVPDLPKLGVVDPPQEPAMIEELIPQKGEYFCVANPNNARLAIYETYSYSRYGSYNVAGRQDMVDVYLPAIDIAVVDLVTQKTLFKDKIGLNAEQSYRVPAGIKQGDAYIPSLSFDRTGYLEEKLRGVLK